MNLFARIRQSSRELILFAIAALALGMAFSMVDATFNNFLNEKFALSGFQRSFLEFPRELPGFLVVFVSAVLWFLCSRRLGVVAMILSAAGALLIGFASSSYWVMIAWLFIYSMGQHLFMPIASTIGMELAREGRMAAAWDNSTPSAILPPSWAASVWCWIQISQIQLPAHFRHFRCVAVFSRCLVVHDEA